MVTSVTLVDAIMNLFFCQYYHSYIVKEALIICVVMFSFFATENMDYMPDDNSRYKDVDYWDDRYKTEQCYEWLGSYSKFHHLLEQHVKKDDSILILGEFCYDECHFI